MSSRVVRRLASWIALVAILAVTFMPTLTSALSLPVGGVDVCSADASRTSPPADGHHTVDHCPYCALHAQLALPPVPSSAAGAMALRFRELPAAFLRAPRATGTWSTSQARAPPVLA